MRPAVKICGVTTPDDATLAVDLGAEYVGINFYPGSPRCVSVARAQQIATAIRGSCRLVAVVAGAPPAAVAMILDEVAPDLVQFHGEEPWREIEPFADRAIKVLRVRERPSPEELARYPRVWGFLFDTWQEDRIGGTGERWQWSRLSDLGVEQPIFLAGGIGPDSVRRASETGAEVLDVCSGVESGPGRKDRSLLERLFAELNRGIA